MGNRRRSARPFSQTLFALEDRVVPSAYYVDNAFAGKSDGSVVTFNAGQSNQVTGLVVGTNAFSTIPAALTAANTHSGADSITLANGTFDVDPTANGGAFEITDPLTLIGSGQGVTKILAVSNTVDESGTDGAIFAAISTTLGVQDLTVDGNSSSGILTADGFRYVDSSGSATDVTITDVSYFDVTSGGYGIVVTGPSDNVAISGSTFTDNGRGGVRYQNGATGTVESSTFNGLSGNNVTNYGLDIEEGAKNVLVTGNTINGFSGTTGTYTSAGIQIIDNPNFDYTMGTDNPPTNLEQPATATIIGNSFTNNNTAILIGIQSGDESTATVAYNNIADGNTYGIYNGGSNTVMATDNYWGSTNGPLAPDNPSGNAESEVSSGVTYKDTTMTAPPDGILQAPTPVMVAATPSDYLAAVAPALTISGPPAGTTAPITLTFTFSAAVSGFSKSSITLGGTAGTGTVTSVTTTNDTTYSVVVSGLNKQGTLTVAVPANAATIASGIGNLAVKTSIAFEPEFDKGFSVGGGAGAALPVFGVTSTYSTNFGNNVFGASFTGGQRVATADLNGDGTLDYIVASGPGMTGTVLAYDGVTQKQIFSLVPFGSSWTRGVFVSAGDINGDGRADIVITADNGGGARVRIFSPNAAGVFTQLADFIGLETASGAPDTTFRGGARTAVGDFNGDGFGDLVFAAGPSGGPRVAIFNGKTLTSTGGPKLCADFFVYEPTLRNGAFVAAGDVNGDGIADLITGAGNGASRVRVIDGATLISSDGSDVKAIADFYAFGAKGDTGVSVASTVDTNGKIDVVAGSGAGSGIVNVYSNASILADPNDPTVTKTVTPFGTFTGGVFVG